MPENTCPVIDIAAILAHLEDAELALKAASELIGPGEDESAMSLSLERMYEWHKTSELARACNTLAHRIRCYAHE